MTFKPGNLVDFRGRTWIVLPQEDEQLLMIKPLGGTDEEITAVYKPLMAIEGQIKEAKFADPSVEEIDDFETAKLLFNATRLSFRNAGGPFRCMGKLSFRPRSYQVVPLVMALKQDITRLLVADDVGIGKTVEALMILKERIERGDIKRFAVVCPPHLCEQWKQEIKDKLDMDAEIIRSSTASAIDRKLPDDRSAFHHLPYQVISIDYIKSDKRKGIFLDDCPDFVIVDEAHTCTKPSGAKSPTQQQRYHLLHQLAKKEDRHLLLLTATPHSGKNEEFSALLGLLKPELEHIDLDTATSKQREEMSKYFIQRKRENISRWLKGKEETPFPDRENTELDYELHDEYYKLYVEAKRLARDITRKSTNQKKGHFWAALALLRGIMSSPEAGIEMLKNRIHKRQEDIQAEEFIEEDITIQDKLTAISDNTESLDDLSVSQDEISEMEHLLHLLEKVKEGDFDHKSNKTVRLIKEWLKDGYSPIIFCRYIATANYLQEVLRDALPKKVTVEAVTSELADEQRKERVDQLGKASQRVLIATDCLSEGINLQENFDAVVHYDLPWNPNRLEQRDGRVDRFGQTSPTVKSYLLWGSDNPMDKIVLNVLIKKIRDIRRTTGVSVSLGEENLSIMEEILKEVLEEDTPVQRQLTLNLGDTTSQISDSFSKELDTIKRKAENLRSIFAHERVKPDEIEELLKEVDEAIGDVNSVESFVVGALRFFGTDIKPVDGHYQIAPMTLPPALKIFFPSDLKQLPVSFVSPTPRGLIYIGRNHRFVEQLCQMILNAAFEEKADPRVARTAVIQTDAVNTLTTLVQFRVRNVIREKRRKSNELIAEELFLWGYEGFEEIQKTLSYQEVKSLMLEAKSLVQIPLPTQQTLVASQLSRFDNLKEEFVELAEQRALNLVDAHGKFQSLVGGSNFEAVYPVLPPEVMGIYVLQPKPKDLF
ncbi:helicase-related protein [Sediminitomix flava]|uniref:SNF2 domain-containing protein n=1 Tax=Sediminitomix flava TaxID=379075 RepID=A0A315Z9J2_SEDFL|nr:helicase-related protein [Sediminitomix flava]PWJ42226.1 SNF2 domain-containing protein [Sediminitomix flava]